MRKNQFLRDRRLRTFQPTTHFQTRHVFATVNERVMTTIRIPHRRSSKYLQFPMDHSCFQNGYYHTTKNYVEWSTCANLCTTRWRVKILVFVQTFLLFLFNLSFLCFILFWNTLIDPSNLHIPNYLTYCIYMYVC